MKPRHRQNKPLRFGFAAARRTGYELALLQGLFSSITARADVVLVSLLNPLRNLPDLAQQRERLDAVIGFLSGQGVCDLARLHTDCLVNISNLSGPLPDVWNMLNDDHAIGESAGAFLREERVDDCLFFGNPALQYARERHAGLETAVGTTVPFLQEAEQVVDAIRRVRNRTGKIALFCGNDWFANSLTQSCLKQGVAIPGDAMVLGVDDDWLARAFAPVPLSSVRLAAEEIGRAAGEVAWRFHRHEEKTPQTRRFAPVGIVERQSTEAFLVEDRLVRDALRYLQRHLAATESVAAWAEGLRVNRKTLERRFRLQLQTSVADELRRQRCRAARRLLLEGAHELEQVAATTGFASPVVMARAFREEFGRPPSHFRR